MPHKKNNRKKRQAEKATAQPKPARALGVTDRAVHHALDEGSPDRVGTGKSRPRQFTYAGVTYRSQAACARAYGVPSNTFNDRLNRGLDPVTAKPIDIMP